MYVLRLILKSDGKSWAAYKVLKYNFYIGSVKKNHCFQRKKKKGHLTLTKSNTVLNVFLSYF